MRRSEDGGREGHLRRRRRDAWLQVLIKRALFTSSAVEHEPMPNSKSPVLLDETSRSASSMNRLNFFLSSEEGGCAAGAYLVNSANVSASDSAAVGGEQADFELEEDVGGASPALLRAISFSNSTGPGHTPTPRVLPSPRSS